MLHLDKATWVAPLRHHAVLIMIFDLDKYRSVAIVGMAKNVGKTVTLNHLISELRQSDKCVAVTSIGLDGEGLDQVTRTAKPEITLYEGMVVTTAEQQYRGRQLTAEILDVGGRMTSVGRLVTARVKVSGKVIITGPADTASLRYLLDGYPRFGVSLALVDGALSRLSPASPAITDAMILATGAALSANIAEVAKQTKYICQLITLESADDELKDICSSLGKGIWRIMRNGVTERCGETALSGEVPDITDDIKALYVCGAIGNNFVERLRMQQKSIDLVVPDFTKIFVTRDCHAALQRSKVKIKVLYNSRLLGLTVNPWSPRGFCFDSDELRQRVEDATGVKTYDVMKL